MGQPTADPILLATHMADLVDKRIDILRRIKECGSISEAARRAGVSYKAAWQAIESLGNIAGGPLVETAVGGSRGGGSKLTDVGEEFLIISDELTRARAEVIARYRLRDKPSLAHISMSTLRTSMRNQFPAVIEQMKMGSAQMRLLLRIGEHSRVRASLTMESAQLLGLREGMTVLMLAKATAVDICSPDKLPPEAKDDNLLHGTVIRCERERKGGECTLQLAPGITIVGFAPRDHGLHIGEHAVGRISPASIVIAQDN